MWMQKCIASLPDVYCGVGTTLKTFFAKPSRNVSLTANDVVVIIIII